MILLHLQQVRVVAHTTHNRPITTQPDLASSPPTITLSNPINARPSSPYPYTPSYSHPHQNIPPTQTLTRLIVNKLLTLYIYIDILTFMWYNKDNGEGAFLYVKYLTI